VVGLADAQRFGGEPQPRMRPERRSDGSVPSACLSAHLRLPTGTASRHPEPAVAAAGAISHARPRPQPGPPARRPAAPVGRRRLGPL